MALAKLSNCSVRKRTIIVPATESCWKSIWSAWASFWNIVNVHKSLVINNKEPLHEQNIDQQRERSENNPKLVRSWEIEIL